ncbi:hypothetical protein [Macrococcus armenti]|uniref:hypothetical protein n=1 Tax=Macrococcus armenti TaxID=2875764 RepID=UPI001CCD7C7A|nr:hypothetical protein [Macrococcus armenti]UBH14886.1 hypothetical protein LAU44_08960 [Macrococcus armenti]UBH17246.1 hypothetical protein LAU39_08990 [Macrococcus armenti]UBH19511.1 hypothetical protein LAU40_08970 [Macrococcus armenti]
MATRYGDAYLLKELGFQETTSYNLEWFKSLSNFKVFVFLKESYWHLQIVKYGVGKTKMTIHKKFNDLQSLLNYFKTIESGFDV